MDDYDTSGYEDDEAEPEAKEEPAQEKPMAQNTPKPKLSPEQIEKELREFVLISPRRLKAFSRANGYRISSKVCAPLAKHFQKKILTVLKESNRIKIYRGKAFIGLSEIKSYFQQQDKVKKTGTTKQL